MNLGPGRSWLSETLELASSLTESIGHGSTKGGGQTLVHSKPTELDCETYTKIKI